MRGGDGQGDSTLNGNVLLARRFSAAIGLVEKQANGKELK
jgi:hypothetical protein